VTAGPATRRGGLLDHGPRGSASAAAAEASVDETAADAASGRPSSTDPPPVCAVPLLPLYTAAEAARLLAVPESWLRRRVTARQVPYTVLGKHLRFSHADLTAIATAAARPAATAVPARRARRGRAPRLGGRDPGDGW
jgi:excisionase family DNA binding protein